MRLLEIELFDHLTVCKQMTDVLLYIDLRPGQTVKIGNVAA